MRQPQSHDCVPPSPPACRDGLRHCAECPRWCLRLRPGLAIGNAPRWTPQPLPVDLAPTHCGCVLPGLRLYLMTLLVPRVATYKNPRHPSDCRCGQPLRSDDNLQRVSYETRLRDYLASRGMQQQVDRTYFQGDFTT